MKIGRREFQFLVVVVACFAFAGWFPKQITEKWRKDKRTQVERRLLEHAGILAAHFNRELIRIRTAIGSVVEQTMVPDSPDVASFESDPVIRQLTLWQGQAKEGLKRTFTLNNSKSELGAGAESQPSPSDASIEERLVGRMFERTVLFTRAVSKEGKNYGLMALALPYWKSRYGRDAVVVATVDMKFFYLPIPTPEPPTYYVFFGRHLVYGFESKALEQQVAEKVISENYPARPQGFISHQEFPVGVVSIAIEPLGSTDFQVAATEEYEKGGIGAGVEILIFLALASLFGWTLFALYFARTGRVPTVVRRLFIHAQRAQDIGQENRADGMHTLPPGASPSLCRAIVLHGGLHHLNRLIEQLPPHDVIVLLNDFFVISKTHVVESGGYFEKYGESSFTAYWVGDHEDSAKKAVACALAIRTDLVALNESRKLDGQQMLWAGLGLHVGTVVMGEVMPSVYHHLSAVGEVVNCARSLMHLSADAGMNLLISHDLHLLVHVSFQSQLLGERRLTEDTGVTKCFSVTGYLEGGKISLHQVVPPSPTAAMVGESTTFGTMILKIHQARWTINNGSQMVGPYDDQKIAQMLFSQEIDFENECWAEKDGKRSTLSASGMFKGSEDPGANLWVYDQKIIHGPLTPAFVLAASTHGALSSKSWVCQKSTINGWVPLKDFIQAANGPSRKGPSDHEAA